MQRTQHLLARVCLLYAVLIPLSGLLTLYVVAMWRVALPSYDVVDHHAFLAAAALGELDWQGLWERHNGVHLIVLPKLVFWLDMRLLDGQGWLVTAVSALAILATVRLVWLQLERIDSLQPVEQKAFALLFLLLSSSVLMAESLLSPINIQWSLLVLGLVLFAGSLSGRGDLTAGRVASVFAAGLMCWLSSAPLSLLLLAALLTLLLTRDSDRRANAWLASYRVLLAVSGLLVLAVIWEWLALHRDWPLLLVQLYRPLVSSEEVLRAEAYVRETPGLYLGWLQDAVSFVGRFVLVPLGHEWRQGLLIGLPLLLWVVALWRSVGYWQASQRFFVFLTLFVLCLAIAAGWMRFFTLYNYRHANTGSLLLLSSLVLVYSSWQSRQKAALLAAGLCLYGAQMMMVAVDEAGAWAYEGRNITRMLQIGDALGIRDPAKFAPVWKDDAANRDAVERSRTIFRQQRVGIYGSRDYARYRGEIALPATEVVCDYRLLNLGQHAPDPNAFVLRAEARTATGEYLAQALILAGGVRVGWAAAQMPSDILWQQWHDPWVFGGQMRLSDPLPMAVEVVAFDNQRRCQPWRLPLPPRLPALTD